jgi:hypothetical protein
MLRSVLFVIGVVMYVIGAVIVWQALSMAVKLLLG